MSYSEFIYRSYYGLPIDLTKDLRQDTQYLKFITPHDCHDMHDLIQMNEFLIEGFDHEKEEKEKKD